MSEIKYGETSKCYSCEHRANFGPNWVCRLCSDKHIGKLPMPYMGLPHLYPLTPVWCPKEKKETHCQPNNKIEVVNVEPFRSNPLLNTPDDMVRVTLTMKAREWRALQATIKDTP